MPWASSEPLCQLWTPRSGSGPSGGSSPGPDSSLCPLLGSVASGCLPFHLLPPRVCLPLSCLQTYITQTLPPRVCLPLFSLQTYITQSLCLCSPSLHTPYFRSFFLLPHHSLLRCPTSVPTWLLSHLPCLPCLMRLLCFSQSLLFAEILSHLP